MSLKEKVIGWLDKYGDQGEKTRAMIVEATGLNSVTVKSYLQDWRKEKRNHSAKSGSVFTDSSMEQTDSGIQGDKDDLLPDEKIIGGNSFRLFTQEEIKVLKEVIIERISRGAPPSGLNYKITETTKPFTYSLEVQLEEKFGQICQELDISKRRAVHLALQEFMERYG